ncbi:MAG: hypothetical protein SFY56_13575 [Bacteroidota bacterium]|nr:hypothetical protein [Bacteroidota bacterium]
MEENNTTTTTTKGKGLGTAGMIIGIVALVWAIIPLVGAAAWWLALVGFILSLVAFFMAKKNNNPKRGAMLAGIIMNVIALGLAIFWIYKISSAVMDLKHGLEESGLMDTAKLRETMNNAMQEMADSLKVH